MADDVDEGVRVAEEVEDGLGLRLDVNVVLYVGHRTGRPTPLRWCLTSPTVVSL